MKVSVIVPCFNMGWCVGRAIDSALSQDPEAVEVIVVDDGSTDDTPSQLQGLGPRVTVLTQHNQGLAAARNAGLRAARGEFIQFLDADDRLLPAKLSQQLALMQADPGLAGVYSDGYLVTLDGRRLNRISAESPAGLFSAQGAAQLRRTLMRGHPFPPHAPVLRRAAVLAAGLFDERLRAREDLDFWLRFTAQHRLAFLPGELIEYTVRPGSLSRSSEVMHDASCRVYAQLAADADFLALPAPERAAHLRAWAIEVGVLHHGPWSGRQTAPRAWAREASRLDPANWRGPLLRALLALPGGAAVMQQALAAQTRRWRQRFASAPAPAPAPELI